jgi:hypothetical protein
MHIMKSLRGVSVLAFACVPSLLSAQSLPAGTTINGTVELEYSNDGNSDLVLLYGDADASFALGGDRGLGVDIGVTAYEGDSAVHDIAAFAALTYRTSYGKFSFGMPRNASSGLSRMPAIGGTQLRGYDQRRYLGDLPTYMYLKNDDAFAGVRYDGDYGQLKTALSFHHFCCSDTNLADLAVKYDSGYFFANGSLQYYNGNGGAEATTFHGEVGAATDFYEAGIGATSGDNILPDAWQAWASYRPMDRLGVSATMLDAEGTSAIWGLSAKYGFSQGGYVQAGVSDTKNVDAIWDLSVGFSF